MTASREDVRKKQWRDLAQPAAPPNADTLPRCEICGVPAGRPCVNSITLARRDRTHATRVLAAGNRTVTRPKPQEALKP